MKPDGTSFTERGRYLAAAALAVALMTGLAYLAVVRPLALSHAEQQGREQQLALHREQAQKLEAARRSVERHLAAATQELSESPIRLEPPERLNHRLALITSIAADHGLKIVELQPSPAVERELHRQIPIRMVGEGDYPNWVEFLHQLHQSHPDAGVAALAVERRGALSEQTVRVRMDLIWHASAKDGPKQPDGGRLTDAEANRLLQE